MPQDVRIWEIGDDKSLSELEKSKLDREERIEEWLEKDISIISNDLLVIGRQVKTDFGGSIDLLCLERNGDLVIVELKKDKTPREIVAQILDYASWVKDLPQERIEEIANKYFGEKGSLDEAFMKQFNEPLPETLNENHRMLIVASKLDSSTERAINYLSAYGIRINAVTFHYFKKDNREYLARVFLIEPSRIKPQDKIRLTEEELREIADSNGVGELYSKLVEGLRLLFDYTSTTKSSITFIGVQDEKRNTIFSLIPSESNISQGVKFQVYMKRFSEFFNIEEDLAKSLLPTNKTEWNPYPKLGIQYSGYEGFFKDAEEVERFLIELRKRK